MPKPERAGDRGEGKPVRPALRWHGGKWRLAPWIIQHFPPHRIYTEAFGGAASVLLRKPRAYAEVYNDLDDDVVGLFRVLRTERAGELIEALRGTPFARTEFRAAREVADDPVESARRLVVRSHMSVGTDASNRSLPAGFRSNSTRDFSIPAHDWMKLPDALASVVERFRGVIVENDSAIKVMARHDGSETLHYVDPPYLPETRSTRGQCGGARHVRYRHEMTAGDHAELLDVLRGLKGMVVLSGYPAPAYDKALIGWRRVERAAQADGARARTEVLWINPLAAERLCAPIVATAGAGLLSGLHLPTPVCDTPTDQAGDDRRVG